MIRWIKRLHERATKGYCYEDLWSFDSWLSKTIANGLREFKQQCHTYPSGDVTWEEWMNILDEMIECFDEQNRGIDNMPCKPDGMTIDFDLIHKRQAHRVERLHRGLELLEKYYYDLWD